MVTTTTSKKFTLNVRDILKGLLVAVITPVFTIILTSLQAGSLTFDWKAIGITAVTAGLAYIMKNFFSPAEIIITNPTEKQVESVNSGQAEVVIKSV